jgi:hypothetical protein
MRNLLRNLLKLAGASGLLCLLFVMPASAQITTALSFTTTFPFYAGNTKMPAGTYRVSPSNFGSTILEIQSSTGSHSAFIEYVPTQADNSHKASDVAFKKYGTTEFLDRLWVGGQQFGMQIEPTKVEQKLAAGGQPQTHSVPAKGQ